MWLPIPGFPNYEASDRGEIRSLDHMPAFKDGRRRLSKGRVLKPGIGKGYRLVVLRNAEGKRMTLKVSRAVLMAHVGPPPSPDAVCRHLNDVRHDDRLENLAWGTRLDNTNDRRRNGNDFCGEKHPNSRLTDADVSEIQTAVEAGTAQQVIADQYGVHQSVISKIASRKAWGHLQGKR
jgi:hypothetical protein